MIASPLTVNNSFHQVLERKSANTFSFPPERSFMCPAVLSSRNRFYAAISGPAVSVLEVNVCLEVCV